MRTVLVTGADGFMGRNLCLWLGRLSEIRVLKYDVGNTDRELQQMVSAAGVIFHLAGVNRPPDESEFSRINTGLTAQLVNLAMESSVRPLVVLSSSIQAALENPYGRSKRDAELELRRYAEQGGSGVVYRLPNVFGKWCRPNYNSVVATFCNSIALGVPIEIHQTDRALRLVYIDDVLRAFLSHLNAGGPAGFREETVAPEYSITLIELAERIRSFAAIRSTLVIPDLGNEFTRKLHATFLSYLPTNEFSYPLQQRTDARGMLAELLKSDHFGQMFVSRTKPGITRGNHYHDTKLEKFCVVQGVAVIRFRHVITDERVSYTVRGEEFRVVDIPPGYTHSIENVGDSELVTLFWANEVFDPGNPDTHELPV